MNQENVSILMSLVYVTFTFFIYMFESPWPKDNALLGVMGIFKSGSVIFMTRSVKSQSLHSSTQSRITWWTQRPQLYYAIGDMIMMFDMYNSLPWFCIGHILVIHQIRREEDMSRPLWLDMFLLISVLPLVFISSVEMMYLLYSFLLIKMMVEGYKNNVWFPMFIIVSDIFIVTEITPTMITWILYYTFIIELSIHSTQSNHNDLQDTCTS